MRLQKVENKAVTGKITSTGIKQYVARKEHIFIGYS